LKYDEDFFLWLIETQLEEIREHRWKRKKANEYSDIVSICIQAIEQLGFNAPTLLSERLKIRYKGKVKEIAEKYQRLWNGIKNE
jgi:pyruvate formate-lyase activating enzyme-like uncharacterized protein